MTDFVLEILSEEIPANMQLHAAENFVKNATEIFAKNGLNFGRHEIQSFVTPRRLTLYISGLNPLQNGTMNFRV